MTNELTERCLAQAALEAKRLVGLRDHNPDALEKAFRIKLFRNEEGDVSRGKDGSIVGYRAGLFPIFPVFDHGLDRLINSQAAEKFRRCMAVDR